MEYFVLNEDSLSLTKEIEDRCLKQFFDIYKEAIKSNFKQILIFQSGNNNWYNISIYDDRTIYTWINSQPPDYSMRIKSLISSMQFVELNDEVFEQNKDINFYDFYYNELSVPYLGATYSLKQLALSFSSNEIWDKPFFLLTHKKLENSDINVSNVTTKEHWNLHFMQILDERRDQALNSQDFETRLDKEFSNIIIIDSVLKKLKNEQSKLFLREIWDAFQELNEIIEKAECRISYAYIINKTHLTISDESPSVKQNKKYSRHRMKIYNDKREFFGHHIKNFTGPKRVHFIIDNQKNKIVIGYIGNHLPTPSY